MRCTRVQNLYEGYVAGELPVAVMARLDEHLAACPDCRKSFEQNDALAQWVRRTGEVAHPGPDYFDTLAGRVLDRLDEPSPAPPPPVRTAHWRRPLWWAGAAAGAALATLALMPQPLNNGARYLAVPAAPPSETMIASASPISPGITIESPIIKQAEAAKSGKRELVLGLDGETDEEVQKIVETSSSVEAAHKLDKGMTGIASNSNAVEQMIVSDRRPLLNEPALNKTEQLSPAEHQAVRETEMRVVALKEATDSRETIPAEVFEQIQLLRTQLGSGRNEALHETMQQLEETVRRQMADSEDLKTLPIVKQASLYLKAENDLKTGQPMNACMHYRRLLEADETSPLAMRANLQLGDLYYSEWAAFREALQYYRKCQATGADLALTTPEREHVAKRLERLERYRENDWDALHLLHLVRHGDWNQALDALDQLMGMAGVGLLLPEAARTIVERMAEPVKPDAQVMIAIYRRLARQSEVESNADVRAWLELSLGDLAVMQFKDAERAKEHYRRSIETSPESAAAGMAQTKWNDLVDQSLLNMVR